MCPGYRTSVVFQNQESDSHVTFNTQYFSVTFILEILLCSFQKVL